MKESTDYRENYEEKTNEIICNHTRSDCKAGCQCFHFPGALWKTTGPGLVVAGCIKVRMTTDQGPRAHHNPVVSAEKYVVSDYCYEKK